MSVLLQRDPGELTPSLQEVKDTFMTNYANGGVDACRTMVEDLAQEAKLVEAVAGGAPSIDSETVELQTVLSPEEVRYRLELTSGVRRDSTTAQSRHSFASYLLGVVDEPKS